MPVPPTLVTKLVCALALLGLCLSAAAEPLPDAIAKTIGRFKVPMDAISIVVQDVDSAAPILVHNPDVPRNPASSIKLLTTFVALAVLGPTYTWPTKMYAGGATKDGVLYGDLYLKGFGDPFLVVEDFWKMLGDLRGSGIHTIKGDLVIDESHFAVPPINPGAFDNQPFRLYNVQPSSTLVNFKAIEFQFSHAGDGKRVRIRTNPEMPNLQIANRIAVKNGKCRGYQLGISMQIPEPDVADRVVFSGAFPSGCRRHSMHRTALTHASYAFGTFQRLWTHWGGTIEGGFRSGIVPKRRPLVVWRSRPLADVIRPLNKWSNNVMTRSLLYSLGAAEFSPPHTSDQGIEVVRGYLEKNEIDHASLVLDNGSGLSRNARASAKFMTDLLRHAWHHPYMPEFVSSMSLNGLDGTTRKRFKGKAEAGKMHLKTGRLDDVAAIAGYVHADSGRTYSVTLLINGRNVHLGPGIEIQNALLAWAYRQ